MNKNGYMKLGRHSAQNPHLGRLSVPPDMMEHLDFGMYFAPEFTEDGILFRFVRHPSGTDWSSSPKRARQ